MPSATLFGQPPIFNTDQGSLFTSSDVLQILKNSYTQISMDGRAIDNVYIERFWRPIKYELILCLGLR